MTRNKNNRKVVTVQPKKKKATPFADAGAIVGSKVSTMFGAPWAKGVGKWLGSGIGQIFGSGDYTMVGPQPEYNVLTNGNQIPKFNTGTQTNIVCHREYLGDIEGGSAFNLRDYPLNPGMARTFPWLSTIAQNYQEYRFHGIIFEFRPLITDFVTSGAPGVVIMSTNYNADAKLYSNKQEMENSEYAISCKPTRDLIHGIECATNQTILPHRYIRTGSVPAGQDLRLYDYGNFQFASQSNPTQTLGELWVSYAVEFFKPILPIDVGGNVPSGHVVRSSASTANPLGLIQYSYHADNGLEVTSSKVEFNIQPGNFYLLTVTWVGTTASAVVLPSTALAKLTLVDFWTTGSTPYAQSPDNGETSKRLSYQAVLKATDLLTPNSKGEFVFGADGTLPGGTTSIDIVVTPMSTEATK